MSTTHAPVRAKPKHGLGAAGAGGASVQASARSPAAGSLGALNHAGPAFGLGGVQRQVALGKAGDSFEKEADEAAEKITAGKAVEPGDISTVEPGALAQSMAEDEPVQKAETGKEPEKKPEAPAVQKAETSKVPEKKPEAVQKAEAKPPEQKVDDKQPVQKAETSKVPEKKPEAVQKAEAMKPEEKKPVQKAEAATAPEKKSEAPAVQKAEPAKMPEKKPEAVQKAEARAPEQKVDDKQPVQKAEAPKMPERKPDAVQKDAAGPGASSGGSMAAAAGNAIASKGAGQALNPSTRSRLESGLGVDLGQVRVHDDARARQAASDLNARAFTHGNDIWLGEGASQQDTQLMAHEATHVVQQAGGVQRMVQRAGPGPAPNPAASPGVAPVGKFESKKKKGSIDGDKIRIPKLKVPKFKADLIKGSVTLRKKPPKSPAADGETEAAAGGETETGEGGRATKQAKVWDEHVGNSGLKDKVTQKLKAAPDLKLNGKNVYYLKLAKENNFVLGDAAAIEKRSRRPFWDEKGDRRFYDVDHIKDYQFNGGDDIGNLWLLDSRANRSAGPRIDGEIDRTVGELLTEAAGTVWPKAPPVETVRSQYEISFDELVPGLSIHGAPGKNYVLDDITKGKQLEGLQVMSEDEINKRGLKGTPDKLSIYTSSVGGGIRQIPWGEGVTDKALDKPIPIGQNFEIQSVKFVQGQGGKVSGRGFKKSKELKEAAIPDIDIRPMEAVPWGGYIANNSLREKIKKALGLKRLSPIELDEVELNEDSGIAAKGRVNPSLPLFKKGLGIDLEISGNGVVLSKTFTADEFALPGPVKVNESSLTLALSSEGDFSVTGQLQFAVERLGEGFLKGSGTTAGGGGFDIEGSFTFDKKLFDGEAKVDAWYKQDKFGASGSLKIGAGKVKGVKSAAVQVTVDGDLWKADGTAELDFPGVKTAKLSVSQDPQGGFTFGGSFELADNIPGIKNGSGSAKIKQKPDGSYEVSASGKAEPKIPGINTALSLSYDNGVITIEGTAGYEKGRLKGAVTVGVTNRPVADGKPGGEPGKTLQVYGGGSLSLKLAPWLQATAGVMFKPNGEIQISGEIGLPESLDIFPEKKLDKNIFSINIDIPIVGVSVLGQRIGIFATIGGGLDLSAGIGPGQLQALKLKVDYNPDHEEETHVQGQAKLHVPAHAGLRLFVKGGLGVGIPIVSAEAGIEVGGQLGLEGALDTGVNVDWTPAKGLVVDANAEVYVEPKLKFDVTGYVLVEADLLLKTIELYSKRWQLAGFEYGSGLRFGVSFPVHYEEGKELNLSLDNVKFQVPDIKPKELLSDLVKKVA